MIIKVMNEFVVCRLRKLRTCAGQSQEAVVEGANHYLKAMSDVPTLLDRVSLSKAENNSIILIPSHVHAIALFLDCKERDIYPYYDLLYPLGGDANAE